MRIIIFGLILILAGCTTTSPLATDLNSSVGVIESEAETISRLAGKVAPPEGPAIGASAAVIKNEAKHLRSHADKIQALEAENNNLKRSQSSSILWAIRAMGILGVALIVGGVLAAILTRGLHLITGVSLVASGIVLVALSVALSIYPGYVAIGGGIVAGLALVAAGVWIVQGWIASRDRDQLKNPNAQRRPGQNRR